MKRPKWLFYQSVAMQLGEYLREWSRSGHVFTPADEQIFGELLMCRYALLAEVELLLAPNYSVARH